MGNLLENNQVALVGEVVSGFQFSHELFGEGFYTFELAVERTSSYVDYLPVMISERLVDVKADLRGTLLYVSGSYRSFNLHQENRTKLVLTVFATEIEPNVDYETTNNIFLKGHICKEPIYRKTPLGREITDILLAVNREYGKSDYIPCVLWGRTARFASTFDVGTEVKLQGRVQSREYQKKISDTEFETRVAYEVSVSKIEL